MYIYISGLGGSGTSYLAKYYLALGFKVEGSDISRSERVQELEALGAHAHITPEGTTHLEAFLAEAQAKNSQVLHIYSAALRETHPERVFFAEQQIQSIEVGDATAQILENFLSGDMSQEEDLAVRKANLAPLADFDWDSKKFIAITGTDGKTTTSTMIYHALQKLGEKCAMITTLGMEVNGKLMETGLHTTTPTSQELLEILQSGDLQEVDYVVLETTSHALAMGRIAGAKFDLAVITNITSEHLDYHKTWENYFESKAKLLTRHMKPEAKVILNQFDEPAYSKLVEICKQHDLEYSLIDEELMNNLTLSEQQDTQYNRSNAAQALSTVSQLTGTEAEKSANALADFSQLTGRMEVMQSQPFEVIVDFAHTANSLEQVLKSLRQRLDEKDTTDKPRKLHVLFGCPGLRDSTKRFPMGESAARYADFIYICPDDPRDEPLPSINLEILTGAGVEGISLQTLEQGDNLEFKNKHGKSIKVFQQFSPQARRDGIKEAIASAKPGDIVAICGKGHEKSLCFLTTEHPWSDQQVVKEILDT